MSNDSRTVWRAYRTGFLAATGLAGALAEDEAQRRATAYCVAWKLDMSWLPGHSGSSAVSAPREDARTTPPENPAEIVRNGMRAMIPADAPLPFTSVDRARFERGRERRAVADVTLFDGRKGRVAVWRYSFGGVPAWAHEWLCLDGGGMSIDDGTWRRVDIPDGKLIDDSNINITDTSRA